MTQQEFYSAAIQRCNKTGETLEQIINSVPAQSMVEIIKKHNDMVGFIDTLGDVKVPAEVVFRLMPLASKMSTLGLALTHEAREIGIDAKCDMQSGKITVYHAE